MNKIISLILNRLTKEKEHFQKLSVSAQKLAISYVLQGAAYPLVSTFINAFIWQQQQDPASVALYNLGNFVGLPITFYINGLLLRKFKINQLYFVGAILIAISAVLVIFYRQFQPIYYLTYGCIYGIGNGFYWANRNFLTLKETKSHERNYFIALNYSLDTVTSIIIPFIIGWLIVLWTNSYQVMIILAFLLFFGAGFVVLKNQYASPLVPFITIKHLTSRWIGVRLLTLAIGTAEGIFFFLPTLLILSKLGSEGILGTMSSLIAIFSAALIYFYGRKAQIHHQKPAFLINLIIGLFSSLIIAIFYNWLGVFIYTTLNSLVITFAWLTSDPMVMDIMDEEVKQDENKRYSLVFDRELFLNIGRWIAVLICLFLLNKFSQEIAFRFMPMLVYIIEIPLVVWAWKKIKII